MHLDAARRVASLGPLADEPVAGHTRFSLLRVVVGAMRISPDRTPSGGLLGAKPRQPSRCQARRAAHRAAHQVQAGGESQDRKGARPQHPAGAAGADGRGDRLTARVPGVASLNFHRNGNTAHPPCARGRIALAESRPNITEPILICEELAAVLAEADEDEEQAEGEGGDHEEVDGDDVSGMSGQKHAPGGRGPRRSSVHVLATVSSATS
jgi:hypothetical protein